MMPLSRVQPQRVLVTGATGFIGTALCVRLLADGHSVVAVSRGVHRPVDGLLYHPRYRHVVADIRTDDLWDLAVGCETLFHLAARAGMAASWDNFADYEATNVLGTQRVLALAMRRAISRVVYVSSSSVYGRVANRAEWAPLQPCNPYGATKAAGELLCRAYHESYGLPVTVIRPFSVYGPGQRPDMAHNIFIRALLAGEPITVDGDGEQTRSNTYVADLVDGMVRAWAHGGGWDVFNLGGDHVVSINELVALCEEATGRKATVVHGPAKLGDQRHTVADCDHAAVRLGWAPSMPLVEGLATQVAWQRRLQPCGT